MMTRHVVVLVVLAAVCAAGAGAQGDAAEQAVALDVQVTLAEQAKAGQATVVVAKGSTIVGQLLSADTPGVYQMECVPGRYDIVVSVPHHMTVVKRSVVVTRSSARVTVRTEAFAAADYKRLGRVVGFVTNQAGRGINDACVWLLKDKRVVGVTYSEGPHGVYELEWYEPGMYSVACSAEGCQTEDVHHVRIGAGQSSKINFVLKPK
jgi:hypothetical protein